MPTDDEEKEHNRTITPMSMNLDMYGENVGRRVFYRVDGREVTPWDVKTVQQGFPKVKFDDTKDISRSTLLL